MKKSVTIFELENHSLFQAKSLSEVQEFIKRDFSIKGEINNFLVYLYKGNSPYAFYAQKIFFPIISEEGFEWQWILFENDESNLNFLREDKLQNFIQKHFLRTREEYSLGAIVSPCLVDAVKRAYSNLGASVSKVISSQKL